MISKKYNNSFLKKSVNDFYEKQIENLTKFNLLDLENKDFELIEFSSDKPIGYKEFSFKKALYFFELDESEEKCEVICNKIKDRKKLKKNELKLPKVNFENLGGGNKILYVGKSLGLFSERLKQHLGEGSEKTYALHLNKWNDNLDLKVKLKLYFTSFGGIIKDDQNDLLELLESSLHHKLKPILGRTGH
jgi:hypothetical protein